MPTTATPKPKAAPKPKAQAKPKPKVSDGLPTGKAREALAKRIVKMRAAKTPWPEVKAQCGLKTASQGRKLMREAGAGDQIAASYDRDEARERRESATK
jgi:hypothetical protein